MESQLLLELAESNRIDYRYRLVDFKQIPMSAVLELNEPLFLPFLPLTKEQGDAAKHLQSAVEMVLDRSKDLDAHTRRNLMLKAEILAGLRYERDVIEHIFKEIETMLVIEQSAGYQRILEKGIEQGIEQGIEKGIEQGIEKGKLTGLSEAVLTVLNKRFSALPLKVVKQIQGLRDPVQLEAALGNAVGAESLKAFVKTLG